MVAVFMLHRESVRAHQAISLGIVTVVQLQAIGDLATHNLRGYFKLEGVFRRLPSRLFRQWIKIQKCCIQISRT